jgi:plastocyanin
MAIEAREIDRGWARQAAQENRGVRAGVSARTSTIATEAQDMNRTGRTAPGRRLAAWIGITALVLAACSSAANTAVPTAAATAGGASGSAAASAAPAGAAAGAVTIKNFSFNPGNLSVSVGQTVTWTNSDTTDHTVTADDSSFDSGHVATGTTFQQTFTKAGTFTYHCKIHPSMKATITVG